MQKICLSTRDELVILDLDKIAYFQANGNYTQVVYMSAPGPLVGLGLLKIEEAIRKATPPGTLSPMIRFGRSLIVNRPYITEISIPRQRLVLSDNMGHTHSLEASKPLLKQYKELLSKQITTPSPKPTENA